MSVRAYRIITKEIEKNPSFNLWQDTELCDFLNLNERLNDDGCGTVEVEVARLEEALADKELVLEDYTREQVQKDIKWAKKRGEDFIEYECY